MISGICGSLTLSGEFWAAIAGAVVGGIISFGVQLLALWSAAKERKAVRKELTEATAHRLFFKLRKIASDLEGYAETVREAKARSKHFASGAPRWLLLQAVANLPPPVEIDADELRVTVSHQDFGLVNQVADADRIHMSALGVQRTYADRRATLALRMPAQMAGSIGVSALTNDQQAELGPLMAELTSLADAIWERAEIDAEDVRKTMIEFNEALKPITGKKFTLEFASES